MRCIWCRALALAWLAQTLQGGRGAWAAGQLAELQALLGHPSRGAGGAGGMLQMPSESQPLAQRPTNAAEPMMLWGDEQVSPQDTWHL